MSAAYDHHRPSATADLLIGPERVRAYLERVGVPDAAALAARPFDAAANPPDAGLLRELHHRHLLTVPFENLSVHLGEDISLATDDLIAKVVDARRGGFCYELNGAFAALLTSLGYPVTLLAARVYDGAGRLGPPFDHLALRVATGRPEERESWLVDVGFGRHSTYPLRFGERGEQPDPGGVCRIAEAPDGDLDVYRNGRPEYRLEPRPRSLSDFAPTCWWQRTSPDSHFTRSLVCSRLTPTGHVTLSGRTLITTTDGHGPADATREEVELPESALLHAYLDHFGIALRRAPIRPRRT